MGDADWVAFDEFDDTLSSLQALEIHIDHFRASDASLKWIVLSTHSALQGACVCFLTATDGSGALTDDSEKALRKHHDFQSKRAICEAHGKKWILDDPEYPVTRVANLPDLLKRLPEPLKVNLPKDFSSKPKGREYFLLKLHHLRNEFTHFPPFSYSIEVSGLNRLIGEPISLIRGIVKFPSWNAVNRFSGTSIERTLNRIEEKLADMSKARKAR